MVQIAGFYQELRHGSPNGPSLREAARGASADLVDPRVPAYLEAGNVLATTGRLVDDVLDPARTGVAPLDVRTDGAWAWPGDLAYYVRTYRVPLPPTFVEHMAANDWHPPEMDVDAVMAVDEELRQALSQP